MNLSYHSWCKALSPKATLLFLHGMGGTGALWRPLAADLEDEFHVLAVDQRGHGKSLVKDFSPRSPVSYTPLAYGQDIVETLESLKVTQPIWVIGHSMGVRTAAAFAHLAPNSVQGLVLIDLGFSGEAGGGLGEVLRKFITSLPDSFESRTQAREVLNQTCPDPSMAQYLMAVSTIEPDGRVRFPFDRGALAETITASRDCSVRNWILEFLKSGSQSQTNPPIYVLRGENSLVWSKEDFEAEKQFFESQTAIHFLEIKGAGHGLPFEKKKEFCGLLRVWI